MKVKTTAQLTVREVGQQAVPVSPPAPMPRLAAAAARLAVDFDHPVHDCFYFALAVQTQNPVVTADTRFHDDKVRNHGNHPCLSDRIVHVVHALSRGAGAWPGNES